MTLSIASAGDVAEAPPLSATLVPVLRQAGGLAVLYAGGAALGFAGLVALFKVGAFAGIDILFYRGLVLLGLAFLLTLCLLALALGRLTPRQQRRTRLSPRDAVGAAALSLALNLSFFVVAPVTVDRSVSLFILGQMAAHPDRSYSSAEMAALFERLYVGADAQIERRMAEQTLSGDVEDLGGRYRISARGRRLIATSQVIAKMFDADARFVSPPPDGRADSPYTDSGAARMVPQGTRR